jgi:putative membrane protein
MLAWCTLGIILGTIAGLIPGLHSNNIAIIITLSPFFGNEIMAMVLSMSITQCFVEFIPSTFLHTPSETNFESILPAQKMLLNGESLEAICLVVTGGVIAVILGALLTPLMIIFLENNNELIIKSTPIILAFTIIAMIIEAKNPKKSLLTAFVIIAAGAQGIAFSGQIFPLITGFFGVSGVIYALREKPINIKQKNTCEFDSNITEALTGLIGGAIVSIMPGIGSNTAAGIIKTFKKTNGEKKYLTMLGAINASNFFFSFAMLFALEKTRNGSMLAISEKIFYTPQTLFIGTLIMIISAGAGGLITLALSKKASNYFEKINPQKLSILALIIMILLVFAFNGLSGLTALFFSTALGTYTLINGVKRSACMASLIIPVLFFYLFILF